MPAYQVIYGSHAVSVDRHGSRYLSALDDVLLIEQVGHWLAVLEYITCVIGILPSGEFGSRLRQLTMGWLSEEWQLAISHLFSLLPSMVKTFLQSLRLEFHRGSLMNIIGLYQPEVVQSLGETRTVHEFLKI